jgi:hypothetical protein
MTLDEVDRVARGRVFTGEQAVKARLVDQLGMITTCGVYRTDAEIAAVRAFVTDASLMCTGMVRWFQRGAGNRAVDGQVYTARGQWYGCTHALALFSIPSTPALSNLIPFCGATVPVVWIRRRDLVRGVLQNAAKRLIPGVQADFTPLDRLDLSTLLYAYLVPRTLHQTIRVARVASQLADRPEFAALETLAMQQSSTDHRSGTVQLRMDLQSSIDVGAPPKAL